MPALMPVLDERLISAVKLSPKVSLGDDFTNLAEALPQIVWVISSAGLLEYSNKKWSEYTGLTTNESHGIAWTKVIHADDVEQSTKRWKEAFNKKTVYEIQYRLRRTDGVYRWHLTRVVPLKNRQGKVIKWLGTSTDIHDQIIESLDLERRKNEFISTASHELKTPITTIKGFSQILSEIFKNDKQASYYLSKMDNQINRITVLVNDLLDVSRIESGKLNLNYETFKIDNLVEEIAEDMQAQSLHHKIIVKSKTHVKIKADYFRLSQVMTNLISNAIKYSPKADKIVISAKELKNSIEVSIKDFGIGISKKNTERVFERFYQVENKIRQSFSGLGLGLHISQEIIKRHGGDIWVESIKGKGSIFKFRIPKQRMK